MEDYKYTVNYDIVFDNGDGTAVRQTGTMKSNHELTEDELRERDWGTNKKIISLKFTSVFEGGN